MLGRAEATCSGNSSIYYVIYTKLGFAFGHGRPFLVSFSFVYYDHISQFLMIIVDSSFLWKVVNG